MAKGLQAYQTFRMHLTWSASHPPSDEWKKRWATHEAVDMWKLDDKVIAYCTLADISLFRKQVLRVGKELDGRMDVE